MKFAIDSSALIAFFLNEAEAINIQKMLFDNEPLIIGPTILETTMVLAGRNRSRPDKLTAQLLLEAQAELISFDEPMTVLAQQAFLRFGKGRHPARLNYGDCMSYALAKSQGVPLLYKGEDFAKTDIASALESK